MVDHERRCSCREGEEECRRGEPCRGCPSRTHVFAGQGPQMIYLERSIQHEIMKRCSITMQRRIRAGFFKILLSPSGLGPGRHDERRGRGKRAMRETALLFSHLTQRWVVIDGRGGGCLVREEQGPRYG